ncbi:MAG: hypothetical protein GY861_13830 [bacterium]|nr:hypothetical protein [bacterium]
MNTEQKEKMLNRWAHEAAVEDKEIKSIKQTVNFYNYEYTVEYSLN